MHVDLLRISCQVLPELIILTLCRSSMVQRKLRCPGEVLIAHVLFGEATSFTCKDALPTSAEALQRYYFGNPLRVMSGP